jgi:hypothetical protein
MLGSTVRWMWEEAGYACYFTGAQDGAMIPISNACWRPELEVRRWSDVLCAHQQGDIAVLSELSASAFARRGERGGPRARLQTASKHRGGLQELQLPALERKRMVTGTGILCPGPPVFLSFHKNAFTAKHVISF